MDQNPTEPLIPCVYCSHSNPASHRFCGICGKALPDLVKRAAKLAEGASGGPIPGSGIGVAGRPPASQTPTRPPSTGTSHTSASSAQSARHENRDLTYLLQDDHVPAPRSRMPFVLGGLLLVAVTGFFALRGGEKAAPTPTTTDATSTSPAGLPEGNPPASEKITAPPEPKVAAPQTNENNDNKVAENDALPPKPEPRRKKVTPAVVARRHPPATSRRHALPMAALTARKKPSPVVPEEPKPASAAPDTGLSASGDCAQQLPALRRAAGRGDAKARASLGLLYSAGRCVPRDLPTAYRWYAQALHAEPDNSQVSAQLEAIWKQMSPAERQLAQKSQ